ncbi:hypothetical protein [uncultured Maribacter sp.]|uniref:hypothetical protein n=1 Tax=uncultured Maribacter sp. TaxID=431308 RepID=UPI00262D395E|nr:hypothetical protein [uncultured Maribacter sp.]
MKSYTAYFFVLLYLLAMARPIMPVIEYIVNKDYIAKVLCINKEKTELNCEGKCYLMQQLKAQEENKKPNLPKVSLEEYPIGFVYLTTLEHHFEKSSFTKVQIKYIKNYHFLFNKNALRPPIFLS